MFVKLEHPPIAKEEYLDISSEEQRAEIAALAEELRGLRVVHVNSTATGGGVAEILQSMVPLMDSLGLPTERVVVNGNPNFFQATKRIHNLLQGAEGALSERELEAYVDTNRRIAEEFQQRDLQADCWFFHDPQVLPLAGMMAVGPGALKNWVCHIDLTAPSESTLNSLLPYTRQYHNLFFSLENYVPGGLGEAPVHITPPAIDPFTTKNMALDTWEASAIASAMGIDTGRPLVTQVSRFDLWKDPIGVVEAYRMARQHIPGLQLALLGISQAIDDPEAAGVVGQVEEYAAGDPDVHLYFYPDGLPASIDKVVNAFQVASDVVLQKSVREGFGLTVAEAMWKGKAVIGGNVGGIRVQIEDGLTGYLVDSPRECAERIVQLVSDGELKDRVGKAARESVRQKFLLPRLALDYLRVARGVKVLSRVNGHRNGHSTGDNF